MKKTLVGLTLGLVLGLTGIAFGGSSTAVNAYINETVPTYNYNYTYGGYTLNKYSGNNNIGMTQTNTGSGNHVATTTYNSGSSSIKMRSYVGSHSISGMKGSINYSGSSVSIRTR